MLGKDKFLHMGVGSLLTLAIWPLFNIWVICLVCWAMSMTLEWCQALVKGPTGLLTKEDAQGSIYDHIAFMMGWALVVTIYNLLMIYVTLSVTGSL
jgi:hypothetical protein